MTTPLKRSNVRYGILLFLFLATVFNYADRATLRCRAYYEQRVRF